MRDTTLAEWLADGDDDDLPPDPPEPAPARGHDPHEPLSGDLGGRRPLRLRLWLVAGLSWALVAVVWVAVSGGSPGQPDAPVARPDAAGEVGEPGGGEPGSGNAPGGSAPGSAPGGSAPGGASHGPAVGGAVGAPGVPTGEEDPAGTASGGAAVGGAGDTGGPAGGTGAGPSDIEVAGAGVLAVRLALTEQDEGGGTARYVDLAVPAGVRWYGGVAIVTVDAVVYDGDLDGWGPPRPVRYAQPIRPATAGPLPAGQPWPLPVPDGDSGPPAFVPVLEPGALEQAGEALAAAGYDDVDVREVLRPEGLTGILVADVEARAPGAPVRAGHQVWISEEAAAVLGTPGTTPVPADPPGDGGS